MAIHLSIKSTLERTLSKSPLTQVPLISYYIKKKMNAKSWLNFKKIGSQSQKVRNPISKEDLPVVNFLPPGAKELPQPVSFFRTLRIQKLIFPCQLNLENNTRSHYITYQCKSRGKLMIKSCNLAPHFVSVKMSYRRPPLN